jgi:hypothetical protein
MDTAQTSSPHPVVSHRVESFYERNAVALQWGIIGVAFFASCGIYWWRTHTAWETHALGLYTMAQVPEDYAEIVAEYPGTRAASWASLREANGYLESALKDSFSNREKSDTDLEKAKKLLDSLKSVSGPKEFKEQVMFASARSLEMASDGKMDPAISVYEKLLKEYPDSHFKREAEERIHALQRADTHEFYAFFSKQHPKPAAAPRPNDDKSGKKAGSDNPFEPITSGFGGGLKKPADAGPDFPLLAPPSLLEKKDLTDEGPAVPEVPKEKSAPKDTPKAGDDAAAAKPEAPAKAEEKKLDEKADAAKPEETPAQPAAEEKKADKPAEPKAEEPKKP